MHTDQNLAQIWLNVLNANGYRITSPRKAIIDIILSTEVALSPLDIYECVRKKHSGTGLVTVYRTIEKLYELGLVQRLHQEGGCHMIIPALKGHNHLLICASCGRFEYFEGDDLSKLFSRVGNRTGYLIKEHWLQLFGTCPHCANI